MNRHSTLRHYYGLFKRNETSLPSSTDARNPFFPYGYAPPLLKSVPIATTVTIPTNEITNCELATILWGRQSLMKELLGVLIGGAVGAGIRYLLTEQSQRWFGDHFPDCSWPLRIPTRRRATQTRRRLGEGHGP